MPFGDYLSGSAELVLIVGALAFGANRLRERILPTWSGSPARLAEALLGISLAVVILQALGIAGLLERGAIVAALLAAGLGSGLLAGRGRRANPPAEHAEGPRQHGGAWAVGIAVAIATLVLAKWSIRVQESLDQGMFGFDTMWYQMPFAAWFAQHGSITALHFTDPLGNNWFYPNNSELLHAGGMVIYGRDILSPLVNLAWLLLALLAAWCIGRPRGVGAWTVAAAAIILSSAVLNNQPGEGKNDTFAIALFLCSAAILVTGARESPTASERRNTLLLGGLAAGLAAGAKLTMLGPIAALSIGVVAIAERGRRRAAAGVWAAALLVPSAFWYLRNLVDVGNPLPWIKLGIGALSLPAPQTHVDAYRPALSVAHYLTDFGVWRHDLIPDLAQRLGGHWWLVLVLVICGALSALLVGGIRSGSNLPSTAPLLRTERMLGAVALASLAAYLVMPNTAPGPEGHPQLFGANLRYAAPGLILGLALLPVAASRGRWRLWGPAVAVAFAVLLLSAGRLVDLRHAPHAVTTALFAVLLVLAPLLLARLWQARGARAMVAAAAAVLVALIVGLGWPEERHYLAHRYVDVPFLERLHVSKAIAWASEVHHERIAVAGTVGAFYQYGLFGRDLSNRVQFLGHHEPHGGLTSIRSCGEWRRALNSGTYDYVVTTPFLDPQRIYRPRYSPTGRWTREPRSTSAVLRDGPVTVFRIDRPLDPGACPRP